MDLFAINVILTSSCACLLVIAYTVTLIKVRLGSKYRLITVLILILIASNLGTLLNAYATFQLFVKENETLALVLFLCFGEALQDTCFNVSHWLFASQYYRIGTEMPFKVRGQAIPQEIEAA